jgi:hypothetical protein
MLNFIGCSSSNTNIKKYLNSGTNIDTNSKDFMPAIDDLPQYKDISYKYNNVSSILFESDAITLVVDYDEETFEKEKEKLSKEYKFLEQKVVSSFDENKYYIPEHEFSINSYKFKVVNEYNNYKAKCPKSFGMLGISDEKKSIAYLYFYDYDLDYISKNSKTPMADFINDYFNYNF